LPRLIAIAGRFLSGVGILPAVPRKTTRRFVSSPPKTHCVNFYFEDDSIPDLRPKEEIEAWKEKCPIVFLERRLIEAGIVTEQELAEINNQVMEQIEDAVRYAAESPLPKPEDALEDIFST